MDMFRPKKQNHFIMLVGLPGCGKSTYLSKYVRYIDPDDYVILSSDNYIEQKAKELGKTYNEVFPDFVDAAQEHVKRQLQRAIDNHVPFIFWDQTNLTVKNRRKMQQIPRSYTKHAWYFPVPQDRDLWKARLASRPGKVIPDHVLEDMEKRLEPPTSAEGFAVVATDFNLDALRA